MGRRRLPDRAWHRWNGSEARWEIVTVRGGRRSCTLCPAGTSEEGARRGAEIIAAGLDEGDLIAPTIWGDAEVDDSAVAMFLAAAKTGEHRAKPKRGGRKGVRQSTLDWYTFRLREAGRLLARLKGKAFDPLTLTTADGTRFVQARALETTSTGRPIAQATIVAELEAVTILQRWFVLRRWCERATWDDVARPEVVSSREPLRADVVGRFLRAAEKLTRDPRRTTDWHARAAARTKGEATPAPSQRRSENWDKWLAAVWVLMHGLRTEELHHVLVRDIDCDARVVRVVDRADARLKSKASARTVPIMSDVALEELRRIVEGRAPDDRLFDTGQGRGAVASGRTQWFLRRCHETCRIAGIRRHSVHELRHTVATAAIAAGADIGSVRALLGHESEKTTRRIYAHVESSQLALAAARIIGAHLDRVWAAAG